MDEESIRAIIRDVLTSALPDASGHTPSLNAVSAPASAACIGGAVPLEVSARHVHLTQEAVGQLFGSGATLTKKRDLSQPGEFLSEQRVKLVTKKGVIENVAVLGPARKATQVELSLTDCRALDIAAPVNLSGDLTNAGDVMIVGDCGCIRAPGCVIAARAHVHMTPNDARAFGVCDGEHVCVEIQSSRPTTINNVVVRVKDSFALACHIDFDEANAAAASCKTPARIVGKGVCTAVCTEGQTKPRNEDVPTFSGKLVTEEMAVAVRVQGSEVRIHKGTIVTPAARDVFSNAHMKVMVV